MEIPHKNRIFVMCISPTSVYTANKSTGQLTPEGTNHIPVVTGSLEGEREGEREDGGWKEGREREGGRDGETGAKKRRKKEGRQMEEGREEEGERGREGKRTIYNYTIMYMYTHEEHMSPYMHMLWPATGHEI